jgi:hypothetical protein
MSEYFYITRNSGPFIKEGRREITEAEWRSAVASVPELAIEQPEQTGPRGAATGTWAVWRSYPGGYPAWFVLQRDGDVEVKGMDEALFAKFKQLATALGARIFCEDGEEFTLTWPNKSPEPTAVTPSVPPSRPTSFVRRWLSFLR